jgi:hypothetical protein
VSDLPSAKRDRPKSASLIKVILISSLAFFGGVSCSSKVMKANNSQEILKNDEFDKAVSVQSMPTGEAVAKSGTYVVKPGPAPVPNPLVPPKTEIKVGKKTSIRVGDKPVVGRKQRKIPAVSIASVGASSNASATPNPAATPSVNPLAHEPSIEDSEGFENRRPKKDPFRVGEKVTLDVSYFGVSAGDMTVEVRPFKEVNGRKSYTFAGTAVSTSVFAMFYAVDDWFETFVDYETLTPSNYALHVKETKQLRETRAIFDWPNLKAKWWDKKIDADQKVEEKKKEWDIQAYSQDIFTSVYYLRTFQLRPGKKIMFRVAHEGENLVVTTEVVRREKLSTALGDLDTVVVKPKIELNGVFRPVGDIFLWLTDDDRKFVVRIESKIKIGTIVGAVKKIEPGIQQN